ncbi:MAG TPA: winged helix-turn-helix domain-containing protein [Chitinophagaceae bacterium]|nr:winged helix-turn-helix domain-containing protein [Chitinophagaceae bacterium]
MNQKHYIVASRYHVRPAINTVWDSLLQTEVRVEPRLMKLLCILSQHSGQLVTREQLVKEIWDDYGGGEEGLTLAISALRKLLNDAAKELIRTIPKKGYILQAEIEDPTKPNEAMASSEKNSWRRPVLYSSALLLAVAVLLGLLYFSKDNNAPAFLSKEQERNVPFDEVNKKTEETWFNTITTVGADSTQYKLQIIGDRRPQFYINGQLVSPDEMENHLDLINNLKNELQKRTKQ